MTGPSTRVPRLAGLTALGLIATGLVRFGSRWLSESWYGIDGLAFVTVAISVSTIAVIPGAIGLSAGTTKLIAEETVEGRGKATAATSVRWGMAAGALASVIAGIYATSDPAVTEFGAAGAILISLLTLAFAAYTIGKAVSFGFGRIGAYSKNEGAGLILFVLGAFASWATGRIEVMILALVLAYVPVARDSFIGDFDRDEPVKRRTLLGYSAVGTVGSLAGIGFTAATPLVASIFGGIGGVALIGAILAILEPLNLAPRAVGLAILPDISRSEARADVGESADTLKTATGLVAAAALPVCLLLLLERDRFLGWIFSSDLVGGPTLGWFAMAFMVSVIGAPAVTALAASDVKLASVSMTASVVGFAVAAIVWVIQGDGMGVTAIALGYFVGSLIRVGVPIATAWRRFSLAWSGQWLRITGAASVGVVLSTQSPSFLLDIGMVLVAVGAMSPELRHVALGFRRQA